MVTALVSEATFIPPTLLHDGLYTRNFLIPSWRAKLLHRVFWQEQKATILLLGFLLSKVKYMERKQVGSLNLTYYLQASQQWNTLYD